MIQRWHEEGSDTYRLFHGAIEGAPGVTLDRYGPSLLLQSFREPVGAALFDEIQGSCEELLGSPLSFVYNHRGKEKGEHFESWHEPVQEALAPVVCQELGVQYWNIARHRGIDPLFFLDFRVARRWLLAHSAGKSVLNLFAYTCTGGVAAAKAGATEVCNVDFAGTALEWGRKHAALNGLEDAPIEWMQEDVIPVLRQLAGLPLKGRARARRKKVTPIKARQFDIVVLDPPTWSKSPWGAVDLVRDYQSLFKPALLATKEGGVLLATNHVSTVDREQWCESLRRCATKAGRPLKDLALLMPEADFPSPDQNPPLKMALCYV